MDTQLGTMFKTLLAAILGTSWRHCLRPCLEPCRRWRLSEVLTGDPVGHAVDDLHGNLMETPSVTFLKIPLKTLEKGCIDD